LGRRLSRIGAALKKALIVGVTGQDGSYLSELLLEKGYEVHGTKRRSSSFNTQRIDHLMQHPAFFLHYADVTDALALSYLIKTLHPDEIYNLAAQSHVAVSFELQRHSVDVAGIGAMNVFEAVRKHCPEARVYQAGSSEMFGDMPSPQNEETKFRPRSPYACAKVFAHHVAVNYREAYGLFIANGILFNHESPRRGETFVTRKITRGLARIKCGLQETLELGNLDAVRDWGYAPDYVRAMWMMLQQPRAEEFVIATGYRFSVRDVLSLAGMCLDFPAIGPHVVVSDRYKRPTEVSELCGDPTKARRVLGWYPKVGFETMIRAMTEADYQAAKKEMDAKGL
jgi:GDPmannose 4,6-dehydratase